jgi:hypothetical protein
MTTRIRLSRRKGWRLPDGAVVVARPTKWGNPHRVRADLTADQAVALYRSELLARVGNPETIEALRELRGHDLACWCRLDRPCHADVLLEVANW